MTPTADNYGDDHTNAIYRLRLLLGHYDGTIRAWLSLTVSIYVIVGIWFHDATNLIWWPFIVTFVAVSAAGIWGASLHRRTLCEREANAIDLVLDPQAAVTKHDRRLKVAHRAKLTRRDRGIVYATVAATLLAIYGMSRLWPLGADIITTVALGCLCIAAFYLDFARMTHARLQPWCKYCRHGGRGPRDNTRTPRPDPVDSKTI